MVPPRGVVDGRSAVTPAPTGPHPGARRREEGARVEPLRSGLLTPGASAAEVGAVGRVTHLHRYPVKSMGGERPVRVAVDRRGVVGDRLWAVYDPDGRFGSGKTTHRFRRMPRLLELRAAYEGDVPVVTFPHGRSL